MEYFCSYICFFDAVILTEALILFVGQVMAVDSESPILSGFQGLIVIASSAELLFLLFSESLNSTDVFYKITFVSK